MTKLPDIGMYMHNHVVIEFSYHLLYSIHEFTMFCFDAKLFLEASNYLDAGHTVQRTTSL